MSFGLLLGFGSLWSIPLAPHTKIAITLAANDLNRLSLKEGRIAAVYGADLFHVELDAQQGQVFLQLKHDVTLPGQVSLALVTEDGLTQDLAVFFTEEPAQPIVFEKPPAPTSLYRAAQDFFYTILAGKHAGFIVQEEVFGMKRTIDLGWGTMTLKQRILSPNAPFVVDYYTVVGNKPHCHYKLRPNLFVQPGTISRETLHDDSVCGVWLSGRIVRGKNPVTVALLRRRPRV